MSKKKGQSKNGRKVRKSSSAQRIDGRAKALAARTRANGGKGRSKAANGRPARPVAPKATNGGDAGKRLSAMDAAAQVLASAKGAMTTKALVAEMEAKGLWKSPGGKTPAATLYSAIIREIATKKSAARFKKTDRGQFAAVK
jgi:hypothetical protein